MTVEGPHPKGRAKRGTLLCGGGDRRRKKLRGGGGEKETFSKGVNLEGTGEETDREGILRDATV